MSSPPLNDAPWVLESGATSTNQSFSTVTSGEFGFTTTTQTLGWRFGFEIFKPAKLTEIVASDASGAVYSLASDVTGYAPKMGLEIVPWMRNLQKIYLFGYIGSATLTIKNDYSGLSIAPGVDHTVEMTGTGSLTGGGIGYEVHFFDTTTFLAEASYRVLKINSLSYSKAATTFSGPGEGTVVPGQAVFKTDGSSRGIDLSGATVSVGLRFWL